MPLLDVAPGNTGWGGVMNIVRRFWADRRGNFAMISGLLAIPLILAAGLAVDFARYSASNRHLQELADSAALALAASKEQNAAKLETMAINFIEANRNPARVETYSIASLTTTNDAVDLKLNGDISSTLMSIAGYDRLPSVVSALAELAVRGHVEVALILDNTWSMSDGDARGSRIEVLKGAATTLVKELMQSEDGVVRIGLVPYADYVNVGLANRNASWLDVPADYNTTPNPRVCETRTTRDYCIKEKPKTTCSRIIDGIPETYQCGGGCEQSETRDVKPYEVCSGGGDGTAYKWYGCVGSRMTGDNRLHDKNPTIRYPGYVETSYKCPNPIVPLTSKKAPLVTAIKDMVINRNGDSYRPLTYIPAGLVWGLNVLSPTAPFADAEAYDPRNLKPRKVAVLMTDGDNTLRFNANNGKHPGFASNATTALNQFKATNADSLAICKNMKDQGIEIFSVAFMVDNDDAKTMLQSCASDPSHYYDATDSDSLVAAFAGIGASLRVVRLAR